MPETLILSLLFFVVKVVQVKLPRKTVQTPSNCLTVVLLNAMCNFVRHVVGLDMWWYGCLGCLIWIRQDT